jgi:hypothetical protein
VEASIVRRRFGWWLLGCWWSGWSSVLLLFTLPELLLLWPVLELLEWLRRESLPLLLLGRKIVADMVVGGSCYCYYWVMVIEEEK